MVFVLVVVLEVVETMVVMLPGLHDNTLVVLGCCLEEFLYSGCYLLGQKELEIPLVVQGRWEYPKMQVGMEREDLMVPTDHW